MMKHDGRMVKNDDVLFDQKWSNMIRHLDELKSFTNLNLVYFRIVTIPKEHLRWRRGEGVLICLIWEERNIVS